MQPSSNSTDFVSSSNVRLKLLVHLITGPMSPSQLATIEKKHISHVSRALAELRSRGLVEYAESESRERYYKVTTQGYAVFVAVTRVIK